MVELHELSPDKGRLAEKIDDIITNIRENQVGNHEENVISDDDVTIVLSQTDDDNSISKEDSSEKKRSISVSSGRSHRSSHTSPTSNKSKSKSKNKRGFNLRKKSSEESEKLLQVKSVVDENQNGSPGKTKTPPEHKVGKVKMPNDSKVKVVRRGRKVIAPNINSTTTRSPRKRPQSESLSLPDVYKTADSSFSSSAVEKSGGESTVKTRGRRAAATPHSTQKNNENQPESDDQKEDLKGPAKFKKFENITDRMRSAIVLLHRMSPLIVFQKRVADQKSSSEEKGTSEKSSVPDETVSPKLVEENKPEAQLVLSLDELDDSNSKALSPRKRETESVSEGSEEKRPRIEEDATLIVIADTSVTVLIEENSPTDVVNLQITEKKLVKTYSRRLGRPRKSITPVPTDQIALKEDHVAVVVDPESKKTFPAKPKLHSESSDELAKDFVEEAAGVSERQPSAKENEASNEDTQSIDQNGSRIQDTPSRLPSKRGRGRPSKAAPRSVLANILTRRNSNARSVTPPKKIRLSDEISTNSLIESRGDVENSDKGNVTKKKVVKSGARRGRGRPAKTSISPKTATEKSSVVPVATRSTRKTTPLTPLERRIKCCNVLVERDPEIEALCIAMINSERKRKKVAAATSKVEIPVAARVTRGMQKLASKVETD